MIVVDWAFYSQCHENDGDDLNVDECSKDEEKKFVSESEVPIADVDDESTDGDLVVHNKLEDPTISPNTSGQQQLELS